MKKFVINAETCRKPIVNMATGRVIAGSFTPYYDKTTLSFEYLALELTEGETLNLPFSSLCFMNDVCTMLNVPDAPYFPDKSTSCALLGSPLTAKAGEITLFSFGSIAGTDVDENGKVITLTMSDGHTFPIPGNNETSGTADISFASELFREASAVNPRPAAAPTVSKASEPRQQAAAAAKPELRNPLTVQPEKEEPKSEPLSAPSSVMTKLEKLRSKNEPAAKKDPSPVKLPPLGETSVNDRILPSEPITISEPEEELPAERREQSEKPVKKLKDRLLYFVHRYLPPIAAMFIFMILYFFFFHNFIE